MVEHSTITSVPTSLNSDFQNATTLFQSVPMFSQFMNFQFLEAKVNH